MSGTHTSHQGPLSKSQNKEIWLNLKGWVTNYRETRVVTSIHTRKTLAAYHLCFETLKVPLPKGNSRSFGCNFNLRKEEARVTSLQKGLSRIT